jgi:DNA polymerase-3 subunit beta
MKFTVEKNTLFKSLSHVQSIVEKKNTLPILSNILLEARENLLVLSATDMDISITDKLNCNIIEEGSTTISAHTLYDIIRKLPESSEIEIISNKGKIMSLRAGKSKFSLGCLPKEDFPIIEIGDLKNELKLDSQKFLKLIDKTRFAVSNEETRYFLNGIYFHKVKEDKNNLLSVVATDGHRLAKFDLDFKEHVIDFPGVIIPKKTVNELYKLLVDFEGSIKLNLDSNKIVFFIDKSILISKLIDGNFPDYRKVIPNDNNNRLKINRHAFSLAVDRVSTITSDKSPVIKFKLLKNLMNMSSENSENGTATEDITTNYIGDEMEIGFNSKYILEMVNNLEDEEIILNFKDSSSPVTLMEESNPDLIFVLMPMRV